MPNYVRACTSCGHTFEAWRSIHDDTPIPCEACATPTVNVVTNVRTYGVGDRGAATRSTDARERRLDKDRPAYKRLRMEGHQPEQLHGAHELEARATDEFYIKTGGKVRVPDGKLEEVKEMLAEASDTSWSPIEQMHANRSA